MTIKADDRINEAVKAVVEKTTAFERGDVIPHELIEETAGIDRYTKFWGTLIKRLKSEFQKERGITLWAIPEAGYKLLTVAEQLTMAPAKRSRRAERQVLKGQQHLEAIPADELSDRQQEMRAAQIEKLARARRQMRRDRRLAESLGRPTPVLDDED